MAAATREQSAKKKAQTMSECKFEVRGKPDSVWKDPGLFSPLKNSWGVVTPVKPKAKKVESVYLFDPMRPTFIPSAMAASELGVREDPVSPGKEQVLFSPAEGDEVKKPLLVVTPVKPKGKVLQEMALGELETKGSGVSAAYVPVSKREMSLILGTRWSTIPGATSRAAKRRTRWLKKMSI